MNRVLIVDDNPETIEYFQFAFTKDEKTNVDFANTGKQALEFLEKNKYEKVISDLRLNDDEIDGLRILKLAKTKGVQHRILITAVSSPISLLGTAVTYALRKPCDLQQVHDLAVESDPETASVWGHSLSLAMF